ELIEEDDTINPVVTALAYSMDGQLLAIGDINGGLELRNLHAREKSIPLKFGDNMISALLFTPDALVVKTLHDRSLKEIDPLTGKHKDLGPLDGKVPWDVRTMSLSPQGNTIAVGGGFDSLCLLDAATLKPLDGKPVPHFGPVTSLGFSPDGKTLAWGG